MFKVPYVKKLLVFGTILLVTGLVFLGIYLLNPTEGVMKQEVSATFQRQYYVTDRFRAENGYLLTVNFECGESILTVEGQSVKVIYKVQGTTYDYRVTIPSGDVYFIVIENNNYTGGSWFTPRTYMENHVTGEFSLTRTPSYVSQLEIAGAVLLVLGSVILPAALLVEAQTRRKVKTIYQCPRCRKDIRIGLSSCPYCRLDLTKYWVTCKYCGKLYDSHLEKCPKCGAEN